MRAINKTLENIIEKITLKKISVWLKDIFFFLVKPNIFQKRFESRSQKNQVLQVLFYTILNLIAYFTFGAGQSYQASFRLLFLILLISIPFIIINSISFGILKAFNFWKISSYVLIASLVFFFPILILQNFFLQTENYTFSFLSNLCLTGSVIYNLFIIHIAKNQVIKKILLGFVLNIIILNLLLIGLGLFTHDSYSKSEINDPIINEYNTYAEKIIGLNGKPSKFIELIDLDSQTKDIFIGYSREDTLQFYGRESIKFIRENAKKNQNYLDSVIPKMHFQRNKEIYNNLKSHFNALDLYFDSKPCDTCLVKETVYKDSTDNSIFLIKKEYSIDKNNSKHLEEFEKKRQKLYELEEYAYSPNRLLEILFYPTDFIVYLFDLKTDEEVTIMVR